MTNRMDKHQCLTCGQPLIRDIDSEPNNPFASIVCTSCEKELRSQFKAHMNNGNVLKNTKRMVFNVGNEKLNLAQAKKAVAK